MVSNRHFVTFTFISLFCLLIASPVLGGSWELEARYWTSEFTGSAFVNGLPTNVNPSIDLDMDVDGALEGRITARPGAGFFLRARYQNLDASGTQVLDFDVDVGGVELPVEVDLDSFLDFEYGGVALGWQFRSAQGKLRIGPFAEAKGVRGSTGLEAALLGQSAGLVEDFEGGFLSYGVLLEIEPTDRLQLFAEISVLADDDEADLTDTEVGLRYFPRPSLGIGLGYRTLEIDGSVDDVPLNLEYEGAFATLLFRN